jgi:hypothetical protein
MVEEVLALPEKNDPFGCSSRTFDDKLLQTDAAIGAIKGKPCASMAWHDVVLEKSCLRRKFVVGDGLVAVVAVRR